MTLRRWLFVWLSWTLTHGALPAQAPLEELAEQLIKAKDNADPALIDTIANHRTRAAASALIRAYDAMGSILMRRSIARALAGFDGVADAEQPALEKLAEIAGASEDAEVRDAAIEGLGRSARIGKPLLRQLVDSKASDQIREAALKAHVAMATATDDDWYRFLWNLKAEQRKDADGKILGPELNSIRELAFAGIAPRLTEDELMEALRRDTDPRLRRQALQAMHERKLPKTSDMAAWVLDRVDFPGADRLEAARILLDRDGAKAVPKMLDLVKKRDVTPEDLRVGMAKLIAQLNDDPTDKKTAKLLGKGKPHERVFAIQVTEKINDPKLLVTLRKELQQKELEVRRAAAAALAARGDKDSLTDLRLLLTKPKNPGDQRLALEAIGVIDKGSRIWVTELQGYCSHADTDVRNTALELIGKERDKQHLPLLLAGLDHADWSTRLIAVEGLELLRHKDAVPALIERLPKDQGRLGRRIGEALWQLTAQPFETDVEQWRAWWQAASKDFAIVTQKELDKAARDREQRRLRATTRSTAKFFGIKVESRRVIFVVDVSGSMMESMYGHYVGKRGAARIDVAREELSAAIASLEVGTLFNVFAFSTGVEKWQDKVQPLDEATRKAALTWVDRLGAMGATNLYDSIQAAFADPDVDSIFIMSDGEPTNGAVIDPHRIREDVAFWNKHRKIQIHTVAIGSNLEILEWIAKDSGGKHIKIR
ncbi:MAG: HEAT repeat domain-containing protein [Planctomycetes bacterium]|nr:HEAT repeat domain-containing protein [Planctomycetota bacterium]